MITSRTVTAKADGHAMTLGDLRDFIQACENAGAANSTPIRATASWKSWLRSLRADAIRFGDSLETVRRLGGDR